MCLEINMSAQDMKQLRSDVDSNEKPQSIIAVAALSGEMLETPITNTALYF